MKKYLCVLLFLVVIVSVKVDAMTVTAPFETRARCALCTAPDWQTSNDIIASFNATVVGSVQKNINLVKSNSQNVSQSFELQKNSQVVLEYGSTTGSWFDRTTYTKSWYIGDNYTGWKVVRGIGPSYSDVTVPMDNVYYSLMGGTVPVDDYSKIQINTGFLKISKPIDVGVISLVSDNPDIVECTGITCTAKKDGLTKIRVKFNNNNQFNNPDLFYKNPVGFGYAIAEAKSKHYKKNMTSDYDYYDGNNMYKNNYETESQIIATMVAQNATFYKDIISTSSPLYGEPKATGYSFDELIYEVTVGSNTAQVSSCTEVSGITKNSATVNWTYTDVDNDPQTQYQVQLSRKSFNDSGFTNDDIMFASSSVGNATSHTFTGLTASTTYYSRVQTYNAVNGPSGYSSCSFGFTTLEDETPPEPVTIGSCNGTRTFTWTTDGVVTSTEPNSDQCSFQSSCEKSVSGNQASFTYTPVNRIGNVTYTHPGVTQIKSAQPYTYTYSTTTIPETTQSLSVVLEDSHDNKTSSAVCSVYTLPTIPDEPPACTELPCATKISITKIPRITLNKGGTCTLNWKIEERPADMTCTLSGGGDPIPLTKSSGINSFPNLQKNTKYTISCTSGTPPKTISESVICRINPSVEEI